MVKKIPDHLPSNSSSPIFRPTSVQAFSHALVIAQHLLLMTETVVDSILMFLSYFMLIFQTFHILMSKDPKYINLRHIAMKWIICQLLREVKYGFEGSKGFSNFMMVIILGLGMVLAAYPSSLFKAIHLKYFSQQEKTRYTESVNDPFKYDAKFTDRVLSAMAVSCITMGKHITALVQPIHRRNIEEALKNLNSIVIDKKCFWSIYDDGTQFNEEFHSRDPVSLGQYLISGSASISEKPFSRSSDDPTSRGEPTPKNEHENLIKAYAEQCSSIARENGLYKPIKRITIKYNPSTSELQILDLDFGKLDRFLLEEIIDKGNAIMELVVSKVGKSTSDSVFVKFKTTKELQNFMLSVERSEAAL